MLVGAGHAHLHLADHAGDLAAHGIDVTLVDPNAFWYSGMATGMLGGMYDASDDQVDAGALIERRGGRFMPARMIGLDRARRLVQLDHGEPVFYDALSLNLGSETIGTFPGAGEHAVTVKPIANLWKLRGRLEARFAEQTASAGPVRVVVVGNGATGCEVAANVSELARRRGGRAHVTLVGRGDRLLARHTRRASATLARALRQRGVALALGADVQRIEAGAVLASLAPSTSEPAAPSLKRFAADVAIIATGLKAPPLVHELGLPFDANAGLRVDAFLRSVADERVFAAGDCIAFADRDLPKVGVFGVRAAPVLLHNVHATLLGGRLVPFHPQKRYLIILNLGRGEAMALRGRLHWRGRLPLRLKDHIDRKFMDRYRAQRPAAKGEARRG